MLAVIAEMLQTMQLVTIKLEVSPNAVIRFMSSNECMKCMK